MMIFLEIAIFLEQNHIFALHYVTHFWNFSGHFDGSGENLIVATVIKCFLDRKLDPLFLHQQFRFMTLQFDKFFLIFFQTIFRLSLEMKMIFQWWLVAIVGWLDHFWILPYFTHNVSAVRMYAGP